MSLQSIVPAKRTENVAYAIRDIISLASNVAATGKEMYYLNIGDPNIFDWETPAHIIEACHNAMKSNYNGYAPSTGIKSALDAIEKDANKKGINNVLDIFVTSGASEAIEICLSALLDEGDNFLMPTPGYPLYTAVQSKLMLQANPYYLDEENGWQPDINDIKSKINDKTKAIVLINPNNPTGSICKKETLMEIVELALANDIVIFADEIYDKLIFDDTELVSIASLNSDLSCITFSGLSKNYMAPGWRIGWGVVSGRKEVMGDYIEAINKLLRARVSSNHPEQHTISIALNGDQSHLVTAIKKLQNRRDIMMNILSKIDGINLVKPEGAFYAFPSIELENDTHFVSELIKETGVVVVPGSGFGQKPFTTHFRIVILPQEEILEKAFKLIGEFYQHYKSNY